MSLFGGVCVRVCLSVHVFACLWAEWVVGEVGVDGCRWANDMSRDVRLIYLLFPQIEALSITKCKQGEKKEPHTHNHQICVGSIWLGNVFWGLVLSTLQPLRLALFIDPFPKNLRASGGA